MYERDGNWRWIILFFSVFLLFASHYCIYVPAAITDSLRERFSDLSDDEYVYFYNSLFSVYSIPNIILPLLNGFLLDKIGLRVMLFSLTFITVFGQIIFVRGVIAAQVFETILGRLIFGSGSESLAVVNNFLLTKYFNGRELSFAITINVAVANFGAVVNMYMTPRLNVNFGIDSTIWMGPYLCLFSLVCALLMVCIDTRQGVIDRMSFVRKIQGYGDGGITINDFFSFDKIFWYLCITSLFLYSSILCWTNVVSGYFIDEYFSSYDPEKAQIVAGTFTSCIWFAAALTGPWFGYYVDNYGKRTKILVISCGLCILSLLLFFQPIPLIPSIILGISYSMASAAIFPSVSYIVPIGFLGKANGIISACQNLGFSLVPYIIALIKVATGDYELAIFFLMGIALVALRYAWLTMKENQEKGYTLEVDAELIDVKGVELLEILSDGKQSDQSFKYKILDSSERLSYNIR